MNRPVLPYWTRDSIVAVVVFAACHLAFLLAPALFGPWSLLAKDALFKIRYQLAGKNAISPYVAQVDFDDSSLFESDLTSADPEDVAGVLSALTGAYVDTILLDVVYPKSGGRAEDQLLADAVADHGGIIVPIVVRAQSDSSIRADVVFETYRELVTAAVGSGHVLAEPDRDGSFRRIRMVVLHGSQVVPSVSLAAACSYLRVPIGELEIDLGRRIVLLGATYPDGRVRDIVIPIDHQGRCVVNYVGPWDDSFPHYAASTVIEVAAAGQIDDLADELESSVIVVSDTTTGARDYGPIPLEEFYPLSGLHATIINSILTGSFAREMPLWVDLLVGLAFVVTIVVANKMIRGIWLALAVLMTFVALCAYAVGLFLASGMLVELSANASALVLVSVMLIMRRYFAEERSRALLRAKLEHYFSPPVMAQIEAEPAVLDTCRTKTLSILFSDIVGFSAWSSSRDPDSIRNTLNAYFERMVDIVFECEGTVDKFIGDGLMVFFGDPLEQGDHATRAVEAGARMQRAVRELRDSWEPNGGMPIDIRIGIHTGDVVVGNMGSSRRFEYTVIGSSVNLASRLESAAPPGGIMVSESTHHAARVPYRFEDAGTIQAKGFPDPVQVHLVLL
jgi:adenylate cyclase